MWLLYTTLLVSCDRLEDECIQSVVRELPCKVSKLSHTACNPLGSAGCVCSGCASEGRDVLPLHCEQKGPLCSGARTTGRNIQEATQYATCYVCTIQNDWKPSVSFPWEFSVPVLWYFKLGLQNLFHEKGLLKLNYCWMGRESWYAIKKLVNLPFLTLKVRYPAIS